MNGKIEAFTALHVPGDPLVLFNIWDAGSAAAVAAAGAKAIATGSYGVAEAQGFKDGETLPLEVVLDNLRRIVSVTNLPVTLDMEAGYGGMPEHVARSVGMARVMATCRVRSCGSIIANAEVTASRVSTGAKLSAPLRA